MKARALFDPYLSLYFTLICEVNKFLPNEIDFKCFLINRNFLKFTYKISLFFYFVVQLIVNFCISLKRFLEIGERK